eukprot:5114616-Amphidinium_carterae.1
MQVGQKIGPKKRLSSSIADEALQIVFPGEATVCFGHHEVFLQPMTAVFFCDTNSDIAAMGNLTQHFRGASLLLDAVAPPALPQHF